MNSNYYQEERSEERARHHHGHRTEPSQAPYGDPEGFAREDFVSDQDFERMVTSGSLNKKSSSLGPEDFEDYQPSHHPSHRPGKPSGVIGPEDYGEPGLGVPPTRYSPDHTQEHHRHHHQGPPNDNPEYITPSPQRRYDPPPYPPGAQNYSRPDGYASGVKPTAGRVDDEPSGFPMPSATVSGRPAYNHPGGPPPGFGNAGPQGYGAPERGDGYYPNEYGGGRPSQGQSHQYSHIPDMATVHDEQTDPALYYQAAQQLHHSTSQQPPHHAPPSNNQYESHFAAHAQAYGPGSEQSNAPMDTDAIGAAAAVQALKMSAEQNQSQSHQSHPAASKPGMTHQAQFPSSQPPSTNLAAEDENEVSAPPAVGGGGGPQDKIIALAMAQAGKLFDKKNGGSGNSDAKVQAMHSAAATALRLCGEYKSTGKVNLQPGEMQQLIGAAMSFF